MSPQHKSFSVVSRRSFLVASCVLAVLLLASLLSSIIPRLASAGAAKSRDTPVSISEAQDRPTGCCGGDEGANKPHLLAGSYYTVKNHFSAKLLLNNKGPVAIEVQPTLFSLSGERFDAPPVTVDPNSHRFEDFGEWAAIAGDQFREGSIQIFHRGKDLVLGAQIYLSDDAGSLSFEEKLSEPATSRSSRLSGVWWLPSPKGDVRLVVSNATETSISVTTKVRGKAPKMEASFSYELKPHETRVLDLEHESPGNSAMPMSSYGYISVEHDGTPGGILARAMAFDLAVGYSLPIQFSNPTGGKSTFLQGAGLRVGTAGGESLSPLVVAHNAGDAAITVNGRVPYTNAEGVNAEVNLPPVLLSPGDTEVIDIRPSFGAHGVQANVTAAGLEFDHDGAPGSLITSAFSVSKSGNQVFRLPLWDIVAQRSATGGYPWYIEGDSSTVVYIKNVTGEPRQYRMYLKFSRGDYAFPLATVAPGQTTVVDIRTLRDNQIPDANGQTIPRGETRGQAQWSMTGGEDKVLIGRSEQVDLVRGISSNYACINCCGNSFFDGWVTPSEASGFEGDQMEFIAMQRDRNCYGQVYPAYPVSLPSYTSIDTSICNPGAFTGTTTGVGLGSTTIFAGWTADAWFMNLNEQCDYTPVQALHEALL